MNMRVAVDKLYKKYDSYVTSPSRSEQMQTTATDVIRSVVCVSVCAISTRVNRAKMGELIEMSYGWLTRGATCDVVFIYWSWYSYYSICQEDEKRPKKPCIRWGPRSSHERGHFWRDMCQPTATYLQECIPHCLPAATSKCACQAHTADEYIRHCEGWRCQCNLSGGYFFQFQFQLSYQSMFSVSVFIQLFSVTVIFITNIIKFYPLTEWMSPFPLPLT